MKEKYCGLYIDNRDIVFYNINGEGEIHHKKHLWDENYFKLDNILDVYKNEIGKTILSFDGDINQYERLHIIDMFSNKKIETISISHKFISFMLSYIFMYWKEEEKEICNIDEKKNYLIMDLGYKNFKIGTISVENTVKGLDYNLIAYSIFDMVNTRLIYKMLVDYIYNIGNYENEHSKNMKIQKEIKKVIEESVFQSLGKDYININLKKYGLDNISMQNNQFENNILSLIKTNIKSLLEEFYLEHKSILKGRYIDHLVFLGDFNKFPYLADYLKSLFSKKCGSTLIDENYYGAQGALLYGLINNGYKILPFDKNDIVYAGENIVLYNDSEYINLISKDTICPYEEVKLVTLKNVVKNPIEFKIGKLDNGEFYSIRDLDIYLPFSYYGDNMEIKTNVDENRNVDGIISHKRTGEEILFHFSL